MNKIIKTKAQHSAAIARLSTLMNVDPVPGTMHANELELLAHLIEDYEKKHHDIGLPDPLTAVVFRLEQQNPSRPHKN